jgi:microcystin-dependent protein
MEPILGEIRLFSYRIKNPVHKEIWAPCDGQLLPINKNQELFSLLGTRYGGDGMFNFALPNLQGRAPMHGASLGLQSGSPGTTLLPENLPSHEHLLLATKAEIDTRSVANALLGTVNTNLYGPVGASVAMAEGSVSGPSRPPVPVSNIQPFVGVMFYIAIKKTL